MKWFLKYKKWIRVHGVTDYHFLEYSFKNKNKEDIVL